MLHKINKIAYHIQYVNNVLSSTHLKLNITI